MSSNEADSDSDYIVEDFIIPDRIGKKVVNDESADLLGNFDDTKRLEIENGLFLEGPGSKYEDLHNNQSSSDEEEVKDFSGSDNGDENNMEINTKLSTDQLNILLRGASKSNRYVLYVTNLNFETTQSDLLQYFEQHCGSGSSGNGEVVKSVRIPKIRNGGFAFVEMTTIEGFQKGFELHNTEFMGRTIKVQISEGGKKKSANKKNILKQKNRKLAEMRNETKTFNKSGKNYDKSIKKEKAKEFAARKRWRKPQPK